MRIEQREDLLNYVIRVASLLSPLSIDLLEINLTQIRVKRA